MPRRATLRYSEVETGEELPALEVPITTTAIVAGAIASRDYQDVHHDAELARKRGSKDVFMNILTTNGYVGRYVTDWAGPEALLHSGSSPRIAVPVFPSRSKMKRATSAGKRRSNSFVFDPIWGGPS